MSAFEKTWSDRIAGGQQQHWHEESYGLRTGDLCQVQGESHADSPAEIRNFTPCC